MMNHYNVSLYYPLDECDILHNSDSHRHVLTRKYVHVVKEYYKLGVENTVTIDVDEFEAGGIAHGISTESNFSFSSGARNIFGIAIAA